MKVIKCGAIIMNWNFTQVLCIMSKATIKNHEYKWGLPKGHKEFDETDKECCIREVYEEVGIRLKFVEKYFMKIQVFDTMYFVFRFKNKRKYYPKDSYEIAKVRWKNIGDLYNENLNRGLRGVIDMWEDIIEEYRSTVKRNGGDEIYYNKQNHNKKQYRNDFNIRNNLNYKKYVNKTMGFRRMDAFSH
jgi:8-oxo-dGTP pyrophosphatase MutT (NUDIX family)